MDQLTTLPEIPSQPICYKDARELMSRLEGKESPQGRKEGRDFDGVPDGSQV